MLPTTYAFTFTGQLGIGLELYLARAVSDGLVHHQTDAWQLAKVPPALLPECDAIYNRAGAEVTTFLGEALVDVIVRGTTMRAHVAARTPEAVAAALTDLRGRFPVAQDDGRPSIDVTFWNWTGDGTRQRPQRVAVPTWSAIRANYAGSVQAELDALMARDTPPDGGRLLLWHGAPGTGKTHLIRALAHGWRDWCVPHYIVDVDQLLHGNTEYLTSLLLDGESPDEDQWRLVILEDAGEFLMEDAASTQGQGFSRLLNTLDGMLGQSARILVLVTTNRPLSALDPAITRPGRCAMALEVPPLSAGEAASWLAEHEHAAPIGAEATLAELYGVLRGDDPPAPRRVLGFAS